MDVLIFISGFLSLVALIAFFVLCDNVARIRKKLLEHDGVDYWHMEYNKFRYLGEQSQAKTALQSYIWTYLKKHRSRSRYDKLKEQYGEALGQLGGSFPDYPY